MKNLLAYSSDVNDLFGTVNPPGGPVGDPTQALTNLVTNGLRITLAVAGLLAFGYMLWGAFDWLTSGGDSEAVTKGRNKMTQAALGLVLVFCTFAFFGLVAGDVLGIIKKGADGNWRIVIPTLGGN